MPSAQIGGVDVEIGGVSVSLGGVGSTFLFAGRVYPIAGAATTTLVLPGGTGHPNIARNGDAITLTVVSGTTSTLSLDVGGADLIDPYTGVSATGVATLATSRNSIRFLFNSHEARWESTASHRYSTEGSAYDLTPSSVTLTTAEQILPVTYAMGDAVRFTVSGDGRLSNNYAFSAPIILRAVVSGVMTASSIGQQCAITLGLRYSGAGLTISYDDALAFEAWKIATWDFRLETSMLVEDVAASDILWPVAKIDAATDMSVAIEDASIVIEGN